MAVAQAAPAPTSSGPSGMMDGQVGVDPRGARRGGAHRHGDPRVRREVRLGVLRARSARPSQSSLQGDRRTYQQDPANIVESLREIDLDIAEGADMVMVKPAMSYLDVVAAAAERASVPVAAYQVAGKYSMIQAAAREPARPAPRAIESLTSIRRAGAQIVLTYFAREASAWLGG